MVCSGLPECIISLHSLKANQNILHGIVQRMPHMQLSSDIRGRNDDGKRFLALVYFRMKIFLIQPFLVQTILNAMGIIGFCQFLAHCFLHFHFCRYRALGRREKKSEILRMKKNVPWHILAPRRGCFGNHLPLRRVRILAELFLSYGNEVSYTIKKRPSTENSVKGRLNPNAVPPLFSGKTDLLQRLRRQLFRNLVAVIPLEPLSDNGDYRESLPRSCAFSSPIPKPHSVLLCSGLLSAIRDPLCQPGKRTLLLPHLCPCTMYTIGKN